MLPECLVLPGWHLQQGPVGHCPLGSRGHVAAGVGTLGVFPCLDGREDTATSFLRSQSHP